MPRPLWTQKQDMGPAPRSQLRLAYDRERRTTVLFGGGVPASHSWLVYGDTWSWDGRYWTQLSRFGPMPRLGHSLSFDAERGQTVLFGGDPGRGLALRDTWVFDGTDWTQLADGGPSARTQHATAYDENRRRVVLFGGAQSEGGVSSYVGDTWEWDGTAWTQVGASGPPPRSGHNLAYDASSGTTIMFGGMVAANDGAYRPANDTWAWDGSRWTQVADQGPAVNIDAAMTSAADGVVLHGGMAQTGYGDTWQWSSGSWSKVQDIGPWNRRGHALAYDTDRERVVLFGGQADAVDPEQLPPLFGDTWESAV
jgi:hypothetical protein